MSREIRIPLPQVPTDWLNKIRISHIILVSAIMRFFCMSFPSDGGMIFDEAHYVPAANAILRFLPANGEHPPLTKIIVAISIKIFGDHWFAWRFPIVLTALASTYLIYLIVKEVFGEEQSALFAAGFVIFDTIFFIHGNIFLLEMPSIMFGLLFILRYLQGSYLTAGLFLGLAGLANEKALLFPVSMMIYHFWKNPPVNEINRKLGKKFVMMGAVSFLIFCGGLWINDSIWKTSKLTKVGVVVINTEYKNELNETLYTETVTSTSTTYDYVKNPIDHIMFMWNYYSGINANLETPKSDFRPPWSWILPISCNPFNHPTYLATVVSIGEIKDYIINYRAQIPIPIWFMTVPIIILAIIKHKEDEAKFILSWIVGTYVPWVIKDIFQMNMTFSHYFLFTLPVICMGIPWFWQKVGGKYSKRLTIIHVIVTAIFFVYFFPVGLVRTIV